MKTTKLLILILLFSFPLSLLASGLKTKVLKPKNIKGKVTTIVSGKRRIYYPLSFNTPSRISVKGPGKLRIITRVRFVPNEGQALDYKVYYRVDGAKKQEVNFTNVNRSKKATYKKGTLGVPGTGEDIIIELGRGQHTIEFWRGAEIPKVAARYLFTETKEKKIDWVSLCPLFPNEPVDLVTRENVFHYYRFSKNKLLKVRITGPTTLRILNRVENNHQMKGRINYRIQVKEDGTVKHTYLLNSVRSDITFYKNDDTKIPGKAKEIVIDVPDGTHTYEIVPLDKDKGTILGRILFPKKDVKLKEKS